MKNSNVDDHGIPKPKVGSKIYVESHFYISHGSDDVVGGLATITHVEKGMSAGDMVWFVEVAEHPNHSYNYETLIENDKQAKLKKEFGKRKAYPSPDIDTPWIESGDWVGYA